MFIVTEKAMRPASTQRRCFYCQQPIGETHKDDCVLIRKHVMVKITITHDVVVAAEMTKDDIEFYFNESGYCVSNLLDKLVESDKQGCLCGVTDVEHVGQDSPAFLDEG